MTHFIGIDPGKTGAIVVLDGEGGLVAQYAQPMIGPEFDDAGTAGVMRLHASDAFCGVERVHAMPGEGVTSSFTFGTNFGLLRGILATLSVPYEFVNPKDWQRVALRGQPRLGNDRKSLKAAVTASASRRWPELELRLKKDWGRADAAWIAEATRRKFQLKRM